MCSYFLYELLINGLLPTFVSLSTSNVGGSDKINPYENVYKQFFDFTIITSLLVVFRPRVWPLYFEVGLVEEFNFVLDENFDFLGR